MWEVAHHTAAPTAHTGSPPIPAIVNVPYVKQGITLNLLIRGFSGTCFPEVDRLPIVCLRRSLPEATEQQQCHQEVAAPLCPYSEGPCCAPPPSPHGPPQDKSKSTQLGRSANGSVEKKRKPKKKALVQKATRSEVCFSLRR